MTETVLVIDDNPTNVKLLEAVLECDGYVVETAANAGEAWEAMQRLQPRAVLMDIQLPGMTGLELTRRIRADRRLGTPVIIAVTSYAMKVDRDAALEAGCDAFVSKPIDTRLLPQLLGEALAANGASE